MTCNKLNSGDEVMFGGVKHSVIMASRGWVTIIPVQPPAEMKSVRPRYLEKIDEES